MKARLANYLYGDEPSGHQYSGEKADEQKLQALNAKLGALIEFYSERDDDFSYATGYDLDEIDDLEGQCSAIRDKIDRLRTKQETKQFPLDPEIISDTEKDETDWDMHGAAMATKALEQPKSPSKKRWHADHTEKNWTHHLDNRRRTVKRRTARKSKQRLERQAA